jgi:hypothetical protein
LPVWTADGGSLYNQIIEKLPHKTKPRQLGVLGTSLNDLYVILYGQRLPPPEARLVDFRNAMQGGGYPSIDSFMTSMVRSVITIRTLSKMTRWTPLAFRPQAARFI